jgi:hypothetical protein
MEFLQKACHFVESSLAEDQTSSSILNSLKALNLLHGQAEKKRIAVVQSGEHQCMDECLGGILVKVPPDAANRAELEKALPADRANVLDERQVSVESDTKVKNCVRRLDENVTD